MGSGVVVRGQEGNATEFFPRLLKNYNYWALCGMVGSIRHWKLISQSINNTINQAQWGTQEMRILPPAKHTHTPGTEHSSSSAAATAECFAREDDTHAGVPLARAQLAEHGKYLRPASGLQLQRWRQPPNRTHKPSTFPPLAAFCLTLSQATWLLIPEDFLKTFLNRFLRHLSLTTRSVLISAKILLQW